MKNDKEILLFIRDWRKMEDLFYDEIRKFNENHKIYLDDSQINNIKRNIYDLLIEYIDQYIAKVRHDD